MQKRTLLWQALVAVSIGAVMTPGLGYGQSRGTGAVGADSSYHSGSAATGQHGTSGSTEAARSELRNFPDTPAGSDQALDQRIRQALRDDKGLAPYAEEIYISMDGGRITLRGPVKTEKDKADISAAAQKIAGTREIDNQLQVAPNLGGTTGGSVAPR
jgi:osmotically-inducible protein OsmY